MNDLRADFGGLFMSPVKLLCSKQAIRPRSLASTRSCTCLPGYLPAEIPPLSLPSNRLQTLNQVARPEMRVSAFYTSFSQKEEVAKVQGINTHHRSQVTWHAERQLFVRWSNSCPASPTVSINPNFGRNVYKLLAQHAI